MLTYESAASRLTNNMSLIGDRDLHVIIRGLVEKVSTLELEITALRSEVSNAKISVETKKTGRKAASPVPEN